MTGVAQSIGWVLPLSLAQAAMVAAGVGLALWILPKERARLRHAIASAALALVTLAFLASAGALLGDWSAHLSCWKRAAIRAAPSAACRSHGVPASTLDEVPRIEKASAVLPWAPGTNVPDISRSRIVALGWTGVSAVAGVLWLVVVVFSCLREVRVRRSMAKTLGESKRIRDPEAILILDDLRFELGIRGGVELRESRAFGTPFLTGSSRPVIVLPAGLLAALDPRELRGVLAHELAHLWRRDPILNVLQRGFEIGFFFNPFARWISGLAREEREAACDRVGAELGTGSRRCYAETLLVLEGYRTLSGTTATALPFLGEGELLDRVQRLLAEPPIGGRSMRASTVLLFLAASLLAGAATQATLSGAALGSWAVMTEDIQQRETRGS